MLTLRRAGKAARKHISRARLRLQSAVGAPQRCYCPACSTRVVGFFRYGGVAAWGCPECGASARERLVRLALEQGLLAPPQEPRILQVAPSEMSLVRHFSTLGELVTGDIEPERYVSANAVKLDLMAFDALGSFDLIYASHVLEHVPDDQTVLQNIHRQLNPGGQVWLLVPLHSDPTVEGDASMGPRERERQFGQWDHLRQYGPDFADRIAAAGFSVTTIGVDQFSPEDQRRCGLSHDDEIFVGTKAAQ